MKEKNFIKIINLKSKLPYIFLFVLSLSIFFKPITDLDEIWNYNFARCIYNGLIPYADFNILQTPFASYISAFFLSIFGNSLFVFRIASFCLLFITFAFLYKLCFLISKNVYSAFTLTALAFVLIILRWIYNYNNFILLLILLIIFFEYLRCEKYSKKYTIILNSIIGLLIGLIPITKQSTGLIFLISNCLFCLIEIIYFKRPLKHYISRLILSILPIISFLLILLVTNNFVYFYDYAIAGIKTFSHSISYFDYLSRSFLSFVIGIFPIIITICFVICFIRNKLRVSRNFGLSLILFSISGCAVAYPLCDRQHFPVALIPFILCFLCCDFKLHIKWFFKFICIISSIFTIFISSVPILTYNDSSTYKRCSLTHFQNLPINIELEKNISSVNDYIIEKEKQGTRVYIADSVAATYMIPLDRYNKNFDLLLLGNLGTNSIDDLLNDKKGSIILIRKDKSSLNYQFHVELYDHIKNNYLYLEDIHIFEAYKVT